ncbi:unnamed protein product [Malus baccata var. baccata]
MGFAVNCAAMSLNKTSFVAMGNWGLASGALALVMVVGIGAWIRLLQWRWMCRESVKGGMEVNLFERIEKSEEDLRSSATIMCVLSRQLEKLGIRFRVTRKALKEPIAEMQDNVGNDISALAQKNSEATRALAAQEDILEKELGEIQKVFLAMQQKQLELILAIATFGKVRESRQCCRLLTKYSKPDYLIMFGPYTDAEMREMSAILKWTNAQLTLFYLDISWPKLSNRVPFAGIGPNYTNALHVKKFIDRKRRGYRLTKHCKYREYQSATCRETLSAKEMEELRKLEDVQRMLTFLQSRGLLTTSSHDDSSSFLAKLILFLEQPCGELDLGKKCSLVSEYMPKISAAFLEEASKCITGEGHGENCENALQFDCGHKLESSSLHTDFEEMAMVGLDAMQRANSTLEDFLDALNEKTLHAASSELTISERGTEAEGQWLIARCASAFKGAPFRPLSCALECHGLLTKRMQDEFKSGEEYWALERKLCYALMNKMEIVVEDVVKAIHLKSFDYRVLNLLLYQIRGEEEDVIENSFNILRMFVKMYGASAPTVLQYHSFRPPELRLLVSHNASVPLISAKYIVEAEEQYNNLLKRLDPQLSLNYQRRCVEATKEGSFSTGGWFWVGVKRVCWDLQASWGCGTIVAEAAAVRPALLFCRNCGRTKVEVESGSQSLIRMINRQMGRDAILGVLFDIDSLAMHFDFVKFGFAMREGNFATYKVASFATKHGGEFIWDEIGPDFLFNILATDVNLVIQL